MKKYTMLKTIQGSRDGLKVETFAKDETYELDAILAEQFYHQGAIEEVASDGSPSAPNLREGNLGARDRATKVTGPTETKEGEAGVDLDTQNIEELVALARDTYGLEVDTTMSVEDVKALIEMAQEEQSEAEVKGGKKTKKQK